MSVVTDFEKYRRFNLRELQAAVEPAEKPDKKGKDEAKEEPKPLPQEEEQPSKPAENTEMKDTAPATEQSEEVLPTDH